MRDPTEKELWIFLGALIGIFVGTGLSIAMWHYTGRPFPRRCQTIPKSRHGGSPCRAHPRGSTFVTNKGRLAG